MNDISYDNNRGLYFRLCNACSKEITHKYKSQIKQKTCSHSCQMKGNKIRTGIKPTNAFKKGETKGENNVNWKDNNITYGTVHDWMRREFGIPEICEHCDKKNLGSRKHQWANISGKYKRDRSDWLRLCAKCHFKYDNRIEHLKPFQKSKIRKKLSNNTSGYKNVRATKYNTYRPYITINHKQVYLGTYKTPEEAYKVYKSKALELYGQY